LFLIFKSFIKEMLVIWIRVGYTPLFNRSKVSPVSPKGSSLYGGGETSTLDNDSFHSTAELFMHPDRSTTFGALVKLAWEIPAVIFAQRHEFKYITDI
jgi:hypothetical protein